MEKTRTAYRLLVETPEERDYEENLDVGEWIILRIDFARFSLKKFIASNIT
jgi:hypothetical protein